jgi:hypothetical protein
MTDVVRSILGTLWSGFRTRALLAGFAMTLMFAISVWGQVKAYFGQSVTSATISAIEMQCGVLDRGMQNAKAPKVLRLPCSEAEALVQRMPDKVLTNNRSRLVKLSFQTARGEPITARVSPYALDLTRHAKPGDVVSIAYDPARPADGIRKPKPAINLLIGIVAVAVMLAFMARAAMQNATHPKGHSADFTRLAGVLREKAAEALSTVTSDARRRRAAAQRSRSARPSSHARSRPAVVRQPSVQRASRWF